jgi:hypothetical protein
MLLWVDAIVEERCASCFDNLEYLPWLWLARAHT